MRWLLALGLGWPPIVAQAWTPLPRSVDLLDLPSAHVPTDGTLFVSGMAVGWVPRERLLVGVDVAELGGLNRSLRPDPNLRLRYALARTGGEATGDASGETAVQLEVFGSTPLASERVDQRVVYQQGRGEGIYIVDHVETVGTKLTRVWEPRTWTPVLPSGGGTSTRRVYHEQRGWLAQLTLVQRLHLPLMRGGALALHGGAAIGLHAAHVDAEGGLGSGWLALPAWRVFAGVEVDLSRSVRLLASVRYDPDHWNALARTPALGVDTGVQIRLSGNLALQVHVQPGFVGLFWRQ
jgi:hypothetical protein